jgi:flagellar hook-associated protein 2
MTVTRSRNTGLTNVIEGVTLNALKLGTTNLAVSTNLSAADAKVREFVSKFNDALGYLRAKTGLTEKSAGSTTANATYTRGALAGDSVFMTLRSSLLQKVTQRFGHGTLEDLGIEINKNTLQLTVADASKLSDALANDMADTTELLKEIAGAVNTLLEPYVESDTNSVLELRKAQVGESINNFGERMKLQRGRIERESERLREHYYNLQQQYMLSLQQQQEWSAMASSTSSLWNALG